MNWQLGLNFLIAILAISNPLVKVPLWIEASQYDARHVRWRLAVLIVTTGAIILFIFLLIGQQIIDLFGIDLASFRIGGGIVIMLIGINMLNGKAVNVEKGEIDEDLSAFGLAKTRFRQVIVPLVMPMIAGPGSITTVIIYGTRAQTFLEYVLLSAILFGMMLVILGTLLGGFSLRALAGAMTMDLLTRIFGLIVVAIAVQFILEGMAEVFPQWITPESSLRDEVLQNSAFGRSATAPG